MTVFTADAGTAEVRLRVLDAPPAAAAVRVLRTMRGATGPVRAWPWIEGRWVHTDIDIVFGVPLRYTAELVDADGQLIEVLDAPVVQVATGQAVLRDALLPAQKITARLVGRPAADHTMEVRRELLRPWGRAAPIAVTDVRQSPDGTLTMLTLTRAEELAARRLLGSGNLLAITGPDEWALEWPLYLSAGTVEVARTSESLHDARLWTVQWSGVDAPPVTEPPVAATWGDLKAQGAKWRDLRTRAWVDVLFPPPAVAVQMLRGA